MKRSKKIFVIISLLFFAGVLVVGYDISRKTSFPGSKKYLKESILPSEDAASSAKDSVKTAKEQVNNEEQKK